MNSRVRKRRGRRLASWLVRATLAVLLVALGLPTAMVLPFRWIDPPTTSWMLRTRASGQQVRQRWVNWQEISIHLPIAVVAAEDQNFPRHRGFDFESIRSALKEQRSRRRGASTISQQVAKNLFLWPGRSWIRKGIEAYLTVYLELLWPKRRILEVYLNVAEFDPGIFGVGEAAVVAFNKPALELNRRESALLAAVLPNPRRMSAARPSPFVSRRATWILAQVDQLGGPAYLKNL